MPGKPLIWIPGFLLPLKRMWLQSVLSVHGAMELLMKQRNGVAWTREDRQELRRCLKTLGAMTPLLALWALPGGTLFLPLLAWFLDRRQAKNRVKQA